MAEEHPEEAGNIISGITANGDPEAAAEASNRYDGGKSRCSCCNNGRCCRRIKSRCCRLKLLAAHG